MVRHRLTDEQWSLIADIFPLPKSTGRPPTDRRDVVDAILWILRTGSQWRDLPSEFPPWKTIWDLFDKWNGNGILDQVLNRELPQYVAGLLRLPHVHFDDAAVGLMDLRERLTGLEVDNVHLVHRFIRFAPANNGNFKHWFCPLELSDAKALRR